MARLGSHGVLPERDRADRAPAYGQFEDPHVGNKTTTHLSASRLAPVRSVFLEIALDSPARGAGGVDPRFPGAAGAGLKSGFC
jgi:hypothetical protein